MRSGSSETTSLKRPPTTRNHESFRTPKSDPRSCRSPRSIRPWSPFRHPVRSPQVRKKKGETKRVRHSSPNTIVPKPPLSWHRPSEEQYFRRRHHGSPDPSHSRHPPDTLQCRRPCNRQTRRRKRKPPCPPTPHEPPTQKSFHFSSSHQPPGDSETGLNSSQPEPAVTSFHPRNRMQAGRYPLSKDPSQPPEHPNSDRAPAQSSPRDAPSPPSYCYHQEQVDPE